MEKRLSLTIDPAKAKQGAKEIEQALGKLEGKAKTILKAFEKVGDFDKLSQRITYLDDKVKKITGSTDQYAKAVLGAEKAIQSNYAQVKLLNTEVGKELELSKKMVANKKLEFEASSEEAKAINAVNIKTKAQIKLEQDLIKVKEKLAMVNTDQYKQLQKYKRELESAEKASRGLDDQSRKLQRTMMGIGIAASMFSGTMIAQDLIQTLDSYTELQNKLAVVTGETNGLTSATRELLQVAIDSRTTMNATVDLYSKLVRVNQEFGRSQQEILTITETVSKAVAMSGASAGAAEGAVIQFAQALAGDFKTAGQELNSILEQTPGLAQAIAQGLTELGHLGDVTASQLKRLASEGLLNTKDVMEGLLQVTDQVNESFARSSKTIAQGMDDVSKAFTVGFGELDKAWALSENIVAGLENVSESLLSTKEAAGALVGFLSGGAVLAAGGTFAALATLIGPVAIAIGGVLAASAALGAALASVETDAEKAAKEFDRVTESLKRFTKASDVAKETTDELSKAVRNQRESILLANITQLEQQRDALVRVGGGDNSETLQNLKQQRDYLIGTLNLAEDSQQVLATTDLIKRLESESANLDALNKEIERYNQLLRQARIESAEESLTDYLFGGDPDTKKLAAYNQAIQMVNKAVELGGQDWKMYGKVVAKALRILNGEETKSGSIKKTADDYTQLVKSMKEQLAVVGMTTHEVSLYNTELKAREAAEKEYGKDLDGNNKRVREAIELQKRLNAAIATERYNQAVTSAGKPSGMLGQLLDTKKFIEDVQKEGGTTTASGNGLLYYQTFEGVSSGIADAISSRDTANIAQSLGDILGSAVSDSVGKGIASSVGGIAGGLLGGIGGGIAGGLVAGLFQRRTTTSTTGYNVNLSGGNLTSASNTESFRRSGSLISSSKKWTEAVSLAIGEMDSLSNSISQVTNSTRRQAQLLGISLEDYTGTLENKNGNLSDAIDQLANRTAEQAFAAIEKFQNVGESFAETFARLAEIADTIETGFRSTGRNLTNLRTNFVDQYAESLRQQYQVAISSNVSRRADLQGQFKDESSLNYNVGDGQFYAAALRSLKKYNDKVSDQIKALDADTEELYQRLADVTTEAAQEFSSRILESIAELNQVDISQASGVFTNLTQSFLENYYSTQEQFQIAADNAAAELSRMDVAGVSLTTTTAEIRELYDTASSPERLAEILSAANALAEYNKAMEELTGSTGVFVGSLSDALTEAFDKLVSEINGVADSVDNATRLMQRQRAEQTLQNALAEAQATGSVQDSEQLRNALNIISRPSEELYSDYASYMRSLGTSANIIDELRQYGSIPQFATGGYHSGGLRMVGEIGPEIEATGASRIMSNQDMTNALDMRPIANELNSMRKELQATQMQLVRNSAKLNSDIARMREDVNRIRQQQESTLYQ